jgi:hypothetical protein
MLLMSHDHCLPLAFLKGSGDGRRSRGRTPGTNIELSPSSPIAERHEPNRSNERSGVGG